MLLFAGVPVSDYALAQAWYERLFGRPPDVHVHDEECMWQIADGGWIYVVAEADRAGSALITILVDNLDAFLAAAKQRGIRFEGDIETAPGKYRKAALRDPDGNSIAIGEPWK
jgi:catechol 2,3-dioxygenase-like lactoylglutathione lyase family enzyme